MFADEMQLRLKTGGVESLEELNKMMKEVADSILKAVYQRKWNEKQKVKEQPWISSQIREEFKKRRELNRRKRNVENEMEKEELEREYINQKYKVKFLVKEAITISEKKITS